MSYTLAYKGAEIDDILGRAAPGGALDTVIAAKQDALTFDDTPESGSDNPVKSGGIYDAIQAGGAAALAAFATDSVSGDVVSFPDGADGIPVKSFVGSIIPAQSGSGDPAPDNIRPISGWTGANIYHAGGDITSEFEQGGFTSDGLNTAVTSRLRSIGYYPVEAGKTYVITSTPTQAAVLQGSVSFYTVDDYTTPRTGSNGWNYLPCVFTPPSGTKFVRFLLRKEINANIVPSQVTNTLFGSTILLPFGQTVYAGTLTALGGGKWSVQPTHAYRELTGTESFSTYSSVPNSVSLALTGVTPNIKASADIISDRYKHQSISAGDGINVGSSALYIRDTVNCANATGYKAYLAAQYAAGTPVQICYELATLPDPITITSEDLQTLLGANTVWTDCGSITGMTYRADTALYIQKLLNGGGTLQTLSVASPSPSLSLGRVGVLAEPKEAEPEQTEEEAEQLEQTEEPEQTEEA